MEDIQDMVLVETAISYPFKGMYDLTIICITSIDFQTLKFIHWWSNISNKMSKTLVWESMYKPKWVLVHSKIPYIKSPPPPCGHSFHFRSLTKPRQVIRNKFSTDYDNANVLKWLWSWKLPSSKSLSSQQREQQTLLQKKIFIA